MKKKKTISRPKEAAKRTTIDDGDGGRWNQRLLSTSIGNKYSPSEMDVSTNDYDEKKQPTFSHFKTILTITEKCAGDKEGGF